MSQIKQHSLHSMNIWVINIVCSLAHHSFCMTQTATVSAAIGTCTHHQYHFNTLWEVSRIFIRHSTLNPCAKCRLLMMQCRHFSTHLDSKLYNLLKTALLLLLLSFYKLDLRMLWSCSLREKKQQFCTLCNALYYNSCKTLHSLASSTSSKRNSSGS